jgi:hypothetical protein
MKEVKVLVLQNWFDISIQYTGSANNAYEIAKANNRSVTDDLQVGELVFIPNNLEVSNNVLQYFGARNIIPATGLTLDLKNSLNESGIGIMIIENDFEVA